MSLLQLLCQLALMALALSAIMTVAWLIQRRAGHTGKRLANQRLNGAGRAAFAATDSNRDTHGLVTDHWVTGIAGRIP